MTEEQLVVEIKETWEGWREFDLCASEAYDYGYFKGYFEALISVLSNIRGVTFEELHKKALENKGQV